MNDSLFRNTAIEKEYHRWVKKVGSDEPYEGEFTLGIYDVLKAHFLIADFFSDHSDPVGIIGPRDINLLHSALSRQFTSFAGHDKWTKDTCIVATLFYGLIKNHPFHDGNKRTASLCALYQLRQCKRTPTASNKEFEKLTVAIADNALDQYRHYYKHAMMYDSTDIPIYIISQFLQSKTRQIDKHYYQIRYYDLRNILRKYGFELRESSSGKLDIIQYETSRILLFSRKRERRVGTIRCHNLSAVVGRKTISRVRKMTGLTPEKGYDSQVFYKGVDDIQSLIQEYSTLLRRLRDK